MWLLSDRRNDAVLEPTLATLPPGSGFVFRHYHLTPAARRDRFDALAAAARRRGHLVVLSRAWGWGEDGTYGPANFIAAQPGLRLATAHDAAEIAAAKAASADGVFVSPVFPTRSHPGAASLGPARFQRLAALARMPVIALGGMTHDRARMLGIARWGAIDGLAAPAIP
nr:thiamine phosphate synthase [Porphyrobacter sp. GA68]